MRYLESGEVASYPICGMVSVAAAAAHSDPDGEVADGEMQQAAHDIPGAEQFRFHTEQTRHVAAHLCGRGLYQEMLV